MIYRFQVDIDTKDDPIEMLKLVHEFGEYVCDKYYADIELIGRGENEKDLNDNN